MKIILNDVDFYDLNQALELKIIIQKAFLFASSNLVGGDYYEFGVYRGRSFKLALREAAKRNMHCYGFDSFKGLPALHPECDDNKGLNGKQKWEKGQFACSKEELSTILSGEFPEESYTLIEGFFEDSLMPELAKELTPAAIVHIDSDLYESANQVLDFVKPLLQDGTVLIFDDYYCFKGNRRKGEARALSEFLEKNKDIEATRWFGHHCFGASFIITLK